MRSTQRPFSAPLNTAIQLPTSSTISNSQPLLASRTSHDTDILISQPSPVVQSSSQSSLLFSLQAAVETMQQQMCSLSAQLSHLTSSRSPAVPSPTVNIDSRPSSSHSLRLDHSSNSVSEQLRRAEAEIHRLKLELAARPPLINNNLPASYCSYSSPLPSTTLPFCSTNSSTSPHSLSPHYSSTAFQPISKLSTPPLSTTTPHLMVQPHPLLSSAVVNDSASTPSAVLTKCPVYVSPPTTIPAPLIINSDDFTSMSTKPALPSFITSPSNSTASTPFTMTLNNNLPTFKDLAHERPIQFLNDFEIRASSLVGNNDSLLLQTVQQVLSDGALTWFGQLQKSQDRVTTWTEFKIRFSERYHTPATVQSLRTELRLLFQGDTESTLDYFERLKMLMAEIDPECTDTWLKHKFIQKLRSDVRSRLDVDTNLPLRELVRKAQNIESNIEQQKIDDKLKLVANQDKKNLPSLITNNLSINTNNRRRTSPSPITSLSTPSYTNVHNTSNNNTNTNTYRSNNNHHSNHSPHNHQPSNTINHQHTNPNSNNITRHYSNHNHTNNHHYPPANSTRSPSNFNNNSNIYTRSNPASFITSRTHQQSSNHPNTRWWCPHCQRHGHSWERCPSNPQGINYRPTASQQHPPSATANTPPSSFYSSPSTPPSFHHNNSHSENCSGR